MKAHIPAIKAPPKWKFKMNPTHLRVSHLVNRQEKLVRIATICQKEIQHKVKKKAKSIKGGTKTKKNSNARLEQVSK